MGSFHLDAAYLVLKISTKVTKEIAQDQYLLSWIFLLKIALVSFVTNVFRRMMKRNVWFDVEEKTFEGSFLLERAPHRECYRYVLLNPHTGTLEETRIPIHGSTALLSMC